MRVLLLLAIAALVDPSASYRAEIEKHRRGRGAELTAPNGWLAVQGLFWLHEGDNAAGSEETAAIKLPPRAPAKIGVFTLKAGAVTFTAAPGAAVTAAGAPVETFTFEPRKGESSAVTAAGVTLFVLRRGDKIGLRMLDPESDARRNFHGLRYFPLDAKYRVKARFVPYAAMKQVPVP